MGDAEILRRAALIFERRTSKPNSMVFRVFLRVLRDTADKIEREAEG